jgi:hypothetical protein
MVPRLEASHEGSALHQRALDFLKKHNPGELAEVRRAVASLGT